MICEIGCAYSTGSPQNVLAGSVKFQLVARELKAQHNFGTYPLARCLQRDKKLNIVFIYTPFTVFRKRTINRENLLATRFTLEIRQ